MKKRLKRSANKIYSRVHSHFSRLKHAHQQDSNEAQKLVNQGLMVSYMFVEFAVLPIVMDFLIMEERDQHITAAIWVANLRDALSSCFFVLASLISKEYKGSFAMITVCTLANIVGLALLWTFRSPTYAVVLPSMVLLALGKSGQKFLESFFKYVLQEITKDREEVVLGKVQNKEDEDRVGKIRKHIWFIAQLAFSYCLTIVHVVFINTDGERLLFAAILMLVLYVLFAIGNYLLAAESNEGIMNRICKATFWKYPTCCTVKKEENELKSYNVPIKKILCLSFVYLLIASGNTFFVAQARRLTPFTRSFRNDISILFLIKSMANALSKCTCRGLEARSKSMVLGGMICGAVCSFIAMVVVLIKHLLHSTLVLVPIFLILGMTEGLIGGGFPSLIHEHAPKWICSKEDLLRESMIGIGKFLVLAIYCILFKETVNPNLMCVFYLVLVILLASGLVHFAHISDRYANNEECPEDKKVTDQEKLHVQRRPGTQDTQPVNQAPEVPHTTRSDHVQVNTKESCFATDPSSGGKTSRDHPLLGTRTTMHHDMDTKGPSDNTPPKTLVNPIDTNVQLAQVEYHNEEYLEDEKINEEKTLELPIHQPDSQNSDPENNNGTQPILQVESHTKESFVVTDPSRGKTHESTSSVHPLGTIMQDDMDSEGSNKIIPPNDTLEPLVYPIDKNVQFVQVEYPNKECLEHKKITEEKTLEFPIHQPNSQENNNGTQRLKLFHESSVLEDATIEELSLEAPNYTAT